MNGTLVKRASSTCIATAAGLALALSAACGSSEKAGPQAHALARIVTHSESKVLGFTADASFSEKKEDSKDLCPLLLPPAPTGLKYSIEAKGSASLSLAMPADFTFSYDKDQVSPGGPLPVAVTFTRTQDASDLHIHFPVTITAKGCFLFCGAEICDTQTFPCDIKADKTNFTAPLGADPAVTVPVSSCTATLKVVTSFGSLDIASAKVEGTITLAPMAVSGFVGGAEAAFRATGPASVPLVPLLHWDASGTAQNADLTLANPLPGADQIKVSLSPVVHWLATSSDLKLVIDLADGFNTIGIGDPAPITLFSGNLGPLYTSIGLDTMVSDAVKAAIGLDPGFGTAIGAGNIPIPLTDPEVAAISLGTPPTFGSVSFSFSTDVTPPTIVIVAPHASPPPYPHSDTLTLNYSITDPGGTGVDPSSVVVLLDGQPTLAGHGLASGQAIPLLFELGLGPHTFSIAAKDLENNAASQSVTFEIIVTPESIIADVDQFLAAGKIKNAGLANSLQAKLRAAAAARVRGKCDTAANIYGAFINELSAQTGKGVDADAAAILLADVQYLLAHCP